MDFDRTGIILYVINYQECVDFYKDILELKIMFSTEMLTCFAFGSSYLMVELDDTYDGNTENHMRIKTCLRMNVPHVKMLADALEAKNIEEGAYVAARTQIAAVYSDADFEVRLPVSLDEVGVLPAGNGLNAEVKFSTLR